MIKALNLSKVYQQGKIRIEALKNANFEIFKKESVVITGPSGAGKSTLLHLIGGLDEPTEGFVLFEGSDFYKLPDKTRSAIRNEKIGFVFQFYHLLPEFTILENVMLPAIMKKSAEPIKKIRKKAEELLSLMELESRLQHLPSELSGGESQRTAIARALVNSPELLLCDEPTGNLDSKKGEEIMKYLGLLREKRNMALMIVTHDERLGCDFDKRFRIKDGIMEKMA